MRTTLVAVLLSLACQAVAQKDKKYYPTCVGFYNVENLYDTLDARDLSAGSPLARRLFS